jgi:hypothetical protein
VTHRVRHQPEGGALEHQAGAPEDPLTEVGRARSRRERVAFVRGLIQGGRGRSPFLLALLPSQALDVSDAWCLPIATHSRVMLETGKREPSLDQETRNLCTKTTGPVPSTEVIYSHDVSFVIAKNTFSSIPDSPEKRCLDSGSLYDQECPN